MEKLYYQSPVGLLGISYCENTVHRVEFLDAPAVTAGDDGAFEKLVREELDGYFFHGSKSIYLDTACEGTAFSEKVWSALRDIPYGQTASYSEIARRIGSPLAARAVGSACRRNPVPILIPCHRVIGGDGCLAGYAGGLKIKEALLELEKSQMPSE